jgi:signal transduction histidine kinase
MLRVYACLTQDHDWQLVILAALICSFASFAALNLLSRAVTTAGRARLGWLLATSLVAGSGVWATHFVAMLAYSPGLPVNYDLFLTVLSVFIAVAVMAIGFAVFLYVKRSFTVRAMAGGAVVGFAVFSMHYTGMSAVRLPAVMNYDAVLVAASLLIGVSLAVAGLVTMLRNDSLNGRIVAALCLTVGIAGLHFTGMGALTLTPDPRIVVPGQAMPSEWLAYGVAITTLIILACGLAGSILDQRFASRSAREAERLRVTVGELQETKRQLEETTDQLVSALQAAAAGSQAKSQFLAAMSHELRTPLNAIIGFSEVLEAEIAGPLGAKQRGYAGDIRQAGGHLLALVNDVLDLSKLDAVQVRLEEKTVEVGGVIADAIAMVRMRASEADLKLCSDIEPKLPHIRVDARRIRQVLLNLLSNAIKFTPAGGQVTVSACRHNGGIAILVSDTGIGMAAEDIPVALERFGQIDRSLSRKFEGTGLGLPLSKQLVELHGGKLEIESAEGGGTTVTVLLPASRVVADSASLAA